MFFFFWFSHSTCKNCTKRDGHLSMKKRINRTLWDVISNHYSKYGKRQQCIIGHWPISPLVYFIFILISLAIIFQNLHSCMDIFVLVSFTGQKFDCFYCFSGNTWSVSSRRPWLTLLRSCATFVPWTTTPHPSGSSMPVPTPTPSPTTPQ